MRLYLVLLYSTAVVPNIFIIAYRTRLGNFAAARGEGVR